MKYINQKLYPDIPYITRQELETEEAREAGLHTTVASSACGLCTAVTVVDRLTVNTDFNLSDAIRLAYDTNANHRIGTDYKIFAPALAERFGLETETTGDPERLLFCLRTGGCAVAEVSGDREGHIGLFAHIGHFVAVIAVQKDARLVILDPAYQPGRYDEEGRKGKVEVKNGFCLTSVENLTDDIVTSRPGYWLFWRK